MMALFDTIVENYDENTLTTRRKTLRDLCIESVGNNLHGINRLGRYLLIEQKELLIKRLADHNKLTTEYVPFVTYNLFSPKLKKIEFCYSKQVNDDVLRQLGSCGCQLEFIEIENCENVSDAGILQLTDKQYALKRLELKNIPLTKKGVVNIKSHKLKKVNFEKCSMLENEGIIKVVQQNPQICDLNMTHCSKITSEVIPEVARCLGANLEVLTLADAHDVNDNSIQALAEHCHNLKLLNIVSCNIVSAVSMAALFSSCTDLRSLDLSYCNPTLACNPVLKAMPTSLQELTLCGTLVNNDRLLIDTVVRLKNLRVLRLCGVPALEDNAIEEILTEVGENLEYLDLSGGLKRAISDKSLKCISKYCVNIQVLGLSLLQNITGYGLLPLLRDRKRASKIRTLLLASKNMNLEVLQAVATNCVNVRKLDLSGLSMVDDVLLSTMADNCRSLSFLNLKGCTQVSDVGLCEVAQVCPLRILILSGLRKITDKSIMQIANSCPFVSEVYLNGCYSVSRSAVHYLVDTCIPRVYWAHKLPNASTMVKNLETGEYVRADDL